MVNAFFKIVYDMVKVKALCYVEKLIFAQLF